MRTHPIFSNRFFFALALIVLVGFVVLDANQYRQHKLVTDEITSLQEQSNQLNQQNNQLQDLVNNWQADAVDNTDMAARQQLNLQKPGEQVYSFAPQQASGVPTVDPNAAANKAQASADSSSNAHKWWNYFFDNN